MVHVTILLVLYIRADLKIKESYDIIIRKNGSDKPVTGLRFPSVDIGGDDRMENGLKILVGSFWSGGQWNYKKPSDGDYELAKAEGYLFDPVNLTHDQTLEKLRSVVEKISPEDVANAFLYSLSTRQLQYRSALGSYYYALSIPEHSSESESVCHFCNYLSMCSDPDHWEQPGIPEWTKDSDSGAEYSGYNVFNFERYKWGGVRHAQPEYTLFDLEQFLLLPKVTPTEADREILRKILHGPRELIPNQKVSAYQKLITKKRLLKSNAEEVKVLLNILGICGVLSGPEAPCYCERFADKWERAPKEERSTYSYPVNRWKAWDGVNEARFEKVFGFRFSDL